MAGPIELTGLLLQSKCLCVYVFDSIFALFIL
jgi:hypothetical protein